MSGCRRHHAVTPAGSPGRTPARLRASHRAALTAPLLLVPLLLAGCSAASTGPSASGGGTGSGSGSAAEASAKAVASAVSSAMHSGAPAAPQTGPVTTGAQLCAAVPVATAAAALGTTPPVAKSGGDSYLNGEPLCGYSDDGPLKESDGIPAPTVGITVVWGPVSEDPYDTSSMLGEGPVTAVSGVGQKAAVRDGGFEALIGDHTLQMVSVGVTTPSHDQLVALAKAFAAKLG